MVFLGWIFELRRQKNYIWMLQRVFRESFCKIPHILKESYQNSWHLYIAFMNTKCDFEKVYSSPRTIII